MTATKTYTPNARGEGRNLARRSEVQAVWYEANKEREREHARARMAARRGTPEYAQWLENSRELRRQLKEKYRREAGVKSRAAKKQETAQRQERRRQEKLAAQIGPPWPPKFCDQAERNRWKMRNDPCYILNVRMRVQLRKALRGMKSGRKWEQLVGYTVHDLHEHLRRQLPKGYTIADFFGGRLHIDHIIPKSMFDVTKPEELAACWALANLRPLPAAENMRKRARREHLL